MTARERLQSAYELAFFPPRLHAIWNRVQRGPLPERAEWARFSHALGLILDVD